MLKVVLQGVISESHTTNETVETYLTSGESGRKGEKLLKLSPFMDDVDVTRDDVMAKVCFLLLFSAVS